MRAPSLELLRALRSAVNTATPATSRSLSSVTGQTCRRQRLQSPIATPTITNIRSLTTTPTRFNEPRAKATTNKYAPTSRDRGPKSKEDTQTDFGAMDVLGHVPTPATSVDACTADGFHLDNGLKTEGGSGILLVGGEAFTWDPWRTENETTTLGSLLDTRKGVLNIPARSLTLLELLHPKPDLMIIGTGGRLWMLGKEVREYLQTVLGCRIDVMDTGNATAAYNLLAKERGIEGGAGVGGLFLPVGWVGVKAPRRR